jgi:hypothetical protein
MLILTDRELEFLASFNANWRRLYWDELARLLKEGDSRCDGLPDARGTAPPSGTAIGLIRRQAANPDIRAEYRECGKARLTLVA